MVMEPVTFIKRVDDKEVDLIIPEEFIRDFYFRTDQHLMIMVRVVGRDSIKVRDFFDDTEGQKFKLKTIDDDNRIDDEFLLTDMHMDEGKAIGVDIDQEQGMVRLILDFERV